MKIIFLISFILIFSACADLEESPTSQSSYDKFEMYTDISPEAAYHMKKFFITYFIDIAFGSEFGDKTLVSKKWKNDMKVFIKGEAEDIILAELDLIIAEINEYATDGFSVSIVDDSEEANFHIHFSSSSDYADHFPYLRKLVKNNTGLFTTFHNEDFEIYQGHMYVDIERTVVEEQLHLLREEFTQALGLGNDIPYHFDSIFYNGPSRITEYSEKDINVIKLLYHPAILSGLSDKTVQSVLEELLDV